MSGLDQTFSWLTNLKLSLLGVFIKIAHKTGMASGEALVFDMNSIDLLIKNDF